MQHGTLAGIGLQAVLLLHMLRHWPVRLDHTMACFVNGSADGMNQQGGTSTGGIPVVVAHLPHKGCAGKLRGRRGRQGPSNRARLGRALRENEQRRAGAAPHIKQRGRAEGRRVIDRCRVGQH